MVYDIKTNANYLENLDHKDTNELYEKLISNKSLDGLTVWGTSKPIGVGEISVINLNKLIDSITRRYSSDPPH